MTATTNTNTPGPSDGPTTDSLRSTITRIASHRGVQVAALTWIAIYLVVLWLADGALPFDRPAVANLSFTVQMAAPSITMIEVGLLMVVTYLITARRQRPAADMALRAPNRSQSARETTMLVVYALGAQALGWFLGVVLGYAPFSFHLAGSVFGCRVAPPLGEVALWSAYNFMMFAALPYWYFRRRYSNDQLNLVSHDWKNDALVVIVILSLESAFELSVFDSTIFGLSARQMFLGAPLTFVLSMLGTVLPTMVLIYSILLPRFMRLTGSSISTALLGGISYAAMHLVEGWSVFDSPRNIALSLLFLPLQYFGPGMIKSVLTLRTGNAWVHAIGYHAIAPHVIVDTPLVVKIFAIR